MAAHGSSLHTKILLGLALGGVAGVALNYALGDDPSGKGQLVWWLDCTAKPVGDVFLNLLFLTVVPLVFSSLATGVANLGAMGSLGRIGLKTFAYFIATTTVAVGIGLALVNTLQPGAGLAEETRQKLLAMTQQGARFKQMAETTEFGVQTFVDIVPRNPLGAAAKMPPDMLAVICLAVLVGVGLTRIEPPKAAAMTRWLEAVGDLMVFIIDLAMRLAPLAVFCLIFNITARFGFELVRLLAAYVGVVLLGLSIHMFVVFPILVSALGRMNPLTFFRKTRSIIVTAFSTSSSNATLPTSIRITETELGVPAPIAGFVLPLGATTNMNGTSLFEGVTVLFLAQVFGIPLGAGEQAIVIVLSVLMAVGAAGVPGGSIPLMAIVLQAVKVPPEGIAVIIGVDRLLDMCRTTLNVLGDVTCAVYVARSEGQLQDPAPSVSPAGEQ